MCPLTINYARILFRHLRLSDDNSQAYFTVADVTRETFRLGGIVSIDVVINRDSNLEITM